MKELKLLLLIIFISLNITYAQLSGTYTIGGTNPDYKTINKAIEDVNKKGINGPVILKIRKGVYHENISLINQPSFSETNTLTLESETGDSTDVLITGNSDSLEKHYIVYLSGRYITVSSLSISCYTSFEYYYPILKVFSTSSAGLKHCYIYAPSGSRNVLAEFGADSDGRVIFDNNRFEGANNKVLAGNNYGSTIIRNNQFNNTSDFGLEVGFSGGINIIANEFASGVKFSGGYSDLNSIIQNNIFHGEIKASYTTLEDNIIYGYASFSMDNIISGNKFKGFCTIDGNYIECVDNEFNSVSFFGNDSVLFMKNKVDSNLSMFSNDKTSIIGNKLFGSIMISGDSVLFANNFVKGSSESDYFDISSSNNPIVVSNNFSGYKSIGISNNPVIVNNNFSNDNIYAYDGLVRNNNYYPLGGKYDSHPFNYDPMYLNDTDLHATNPLLGGRGENLIYNENIVNNFYDIDSLLRDSIPTIGANEICIDRVKAKNGINISCGDSICLHLCNSPITGKFTWFPADGMDNHHKRSAQASPNKTTTYYLTEANSGYSDSVRIVVNPFQISTISDTTLLCGDSLLLYVSFTPQASYHWLPETFLTMHKPGLYVAKPNKSIMYVVYADVPGCVSAMNSVNVSVNQFQIKTTDDTLLHCGGSLFLESNYPRLPDIVKYTWYPSYGLSDSTRIPVASPAKTTTYIVMAEIPQCTTSYDTVTITVDSIPDLKLSYFTLPPNELIFFSHYAPCADSVSWDFGDGTYSNLDNPSHLYPKTGIYHVILRAYNEYGQNRLDTNISVYRTISISEKQKELSVNIYPNPTNSLFYLKLNNLQNNADFTVTIFDMMGKAVYQKHIKPVIAANKTYSFDLSQQIQGLYLVEIISGNYKVYKKLVKN